MSKKSSKLVDTNAVRGRSSKAEELELERLEIKREMEALMVEYANLTGISQYKVRKHKVGRAPNDYQPKN